MTPQAGRRHAKNHPSLLTACDHNNVILKFAAMDYHLNHQGQTLGAFPLEELRRRRQIGELTGVELVWCPGMPQWQPLDDVLRPSPSPEAGPTAPPVLSSPAATPKKNRALRRTVIAVVLLALLSLILISVPLVHFVRGFVQGFNRARGTARTDSVALAAKPIQWTPHTPVERDVRKDEKAFRIRQFLDGYKQYGHRDPAWDADAQRLIETWISDDFDSSADASGPSAQLLGDKLASTPGCDDPVVLLVASQTCIELHQTIARLERSVKAFQASRYPSYPRLYATLRLASHFTPGKGRGEALDASARALFGQALKDGSLTSADQRNIADSLLDGWGEHFFSRNQDALCAAAADAGPSFEWLAMVLKGEHEINEAWKARGGGWADSVSDKGWRDFARHLACARESLTRAWKLHPEWPIAAGRMIVVCMGESQPAEMREWFDRAVSAQIDYAPAWKNFAWGMRPRWFGSRDALLALGRTAVQTGRFDTDVPRTFFDRVKDIEADENLDAGAHLYGDDEIWPWMQRLYEGYISAPCELANRPGWRSTYAAVAYLAGRYDVAREQLEALDWHPRAWNLQGWGRDFSLLPLEVAVRTSPASNAVEHAELNYQEGLLSRATTAYRQILSSSTLDARAQDFIHHRLALLEQEQAFQSGQWISLLPSATNDLNWMPMVGEARLLADGAIEVKAGPRGHLLFSRVRVGNRLEVKGEFEPVSSSDKNFQAGCVLGLPEDNEDWYTFRMKRNPTDKEIASFSHGWRKAEIYQPISLNDGTNTFCLRLDNDTVTASVNGTEVFHSAKSSIKPVTASKDLCLGLGAYNDMNQTVIRYRHVQVRKLDATTE
jgi:hypothetical protein